jgi:hypothetical protein
LPKEKNMATELDAVNIMLIARGLTPVNTLTTGHPDVAAARNILDRRNEEVQSKKWWFNTENEVQLTLDANDKIAVPAGVIRIDDAFESTGENKLQILGSFLYDPVDRTLQFDDDPQPMTLIYLRDWEDLEAVPFNYIVALAKEEFVRPLESQLISSQAEKDIQRCFAKMQVADIEHKDPGTSSNQLVAKWLSKMLVR